MATVTCDTCGVKPELPEWMRGWFTVRGKSWCPEHRHNVRVGEPNAMDALLHARRVQRGTAAQLDLVCICGSSACEHAEDGTLLGCVDCGYEAREP